LTDPEMVSAQVAAIREDIRVDAVKIGMLGSAEIVRAVAGALEGLAAPVVLDPVMVAKGGDRLLAAEAVAALRDRLLPRADVITPNLPEAADLLDTGEADDREEMHRQAAALLRLGPGAVFLKGGHLRGDLAFDILATAEGSACFTAPRHDTGNTHGTGCTLSAALAALLGQGQGLQAACGAAKAHVAGAIAAADKLDVGGGHGPTHHFHALWND
jgi:hydroxymethylpyrimidine/phosphomethylpyrimidine kinase